MDTQNPCAAPGQGHASLPLVVSIEMGYGHLRAAYPLAEAFGTDVLEVDRAPLASPYEQRIWRWLRYGYEGVCRSSQRPAMGAALRSFLEDMTDIPRLFPRRSLSDPTAAARFIRWMTTRAGLGDGLVGHMRETQRPLLTTFFTPALIANEHRCGSAYCVVTDSDINRVWAPVNSPESSITYFAPSNRVVRRLTAYGIAPDRIRMTGFPLPHALLGGPELPTLRKSLAHRLARLDPRSVLEHQCSRQLDEALGPRPEDLRGAAPLITFAVGGAGAQSDLARLFLPNFRSALAARRIRVALVAGVRRDVSDCFDRWIAELGLEAMLGDAIRIVRASTMVEYFREFCSLMEETDVLWTKPSELAFYAALGIPLILSEPVGVHERYNQRWVVEHGAGLCQHDPACASDWIDEWLEDGTLAAAAWAGFCSLPKNGLYEIVEHLRGSNATS